MNLARNRGDLVILSFRDTESLGNFLQGLFTDGYLANNVERASFAGRERRCKRHQILQYCRPSVSELRLSDEILVKLLQALLYLT